MLQSMWSQRVGHDLAAEQQQILLSPLSIMTIFLASHLKWQDQITGSLLCQTSNLPCNTIAMPPEQQRKFNVNDWQRLYISQETLMHFLHNQLN